MEKTTVRKTVSRQKVGGSDVVQEEVVAGQQADPQEFTLAKISQVVWFVTHCIALILALRFVFLLLGARMTGVVLTIYNISNVFITPFRGIFPSAQTGVSYFDSATLVAILIYYIVAVVIVHGLSLFSKNTEE